MDFRRSLPAFKEKEGLLQAIAQNQVFLEIVNDLLYFRSIKGASPHH